MTERKPIITVERMDKKPIDVLIEALETGLKETGSPITSSFGSQIVGFCMMDFQILLDSDYYPNKPNILSIDHLWPEHATCGTTACIAGHLRLLYEDTFQRFISGHVGGELKPGLYFLFVQEMLEIKTLKEAIFLCDPERDENFNLSTITRTEAISCLKHFRETGKVDWRRAIEEVLENE